MSIRDLKVMTKLFLVAGMSVALLMVVGSVAFFTMREMAADANSMYQHRTVPITQMAGIRNAAWSIREDVLRYLIAPAAERPEIRTEIEQHEADLQSLVAAYEATDPVADEKKALVEFKQAWAAYVNARENPLGAVDAGELAKAQQLAYSGIGGQAFANALSALNVLIDVNQSVAQELNREITRSSRQSEWIIIAVLTLSVIAAAVTTIAIGRAISRPLRVAAHAASRLANGDLTVAALRVESIDEVGQLSSAFNEMLQSLRQLIQGVSTSTQSVMASAEQLSAASEQSAEAAQQAARTVTQLANGAGEQARVAEDVNRTMAELQQTIHQIASGAGQSAGEVQQAAHMLTQMVSALESVAVNAAGVAQGSDRAAQTARSGATTVSDTVAGMERIRQVVGESAGRIKDLEALSAQIGEISDAISGIAEQTNLLALNAAIEAARAGEHGRGFAVVAEEVRKLAERSATSTKKITGLITSIQSGTGEAVRAMEAGTAEVESGTRLAAEAGRSLQEILVMVEKAAADVTSIAQSVARVQSDAQNVVRAFDGLAAITEENTAATEEMAAGTSQVTLGVDGIAEVSRGNAAATEEVSSLTEELTASAEEVAASAQTLTQIAQHLQQQVSRFKV